MYRSVEQSNYPVSLHPVKDASLTEDASAFKNSSFLQGESS